MDDVPGSRAVAFRMPCCDSMNSPSPRFFAEIFNRTTPGGNFAVDRQLGVEHHHGQRSGLPRELVLDAQAQEVFRRYLPFKSFVTTIEDYPYPYVIGRLCWEFPIVVPSDWSAQHVQKPDNPRTVADLQKALDAAVVKQGVFTLVFHPHKWIKSEQLVELVDHAVARHGRQDQVSQLSRSAGAARQAPAGRAAAAHAAGGDNGVRLLDLDNDGYQDVVIGNGRLRQTRLWSPQVSKWIDGDFPTSWLPAPTAAAPIAGRTVRRRARRRPRQPDRAQRQRRRQPGTSTARVGRGAGAARRTGARRQAGVHRARRQRRRRAAARSGWRWALRVHCRRPGQQSRVPLRRPARAGRQLPYSLPADTAPGGRAGARRGLAVCRHRSGRARRTCCFRTMRATRRLAVRFARDRLVAQAARPASRAMRRPFRRSCATARTTAPGFTSAICACRTKTRTSCPTWSIAWRWTICWRTCVFPVRSRPSNRWR